MSGQWLVGLAIGVVVILVAAAIVMLDGLITDFTGKLGQI